MLGESEVARLEETGVFAKIESDGNRLILHYFMDPGLPDNLQRPFDAYVEGHALRVKYMPGCAPDSGILGVDTLQLPDDARNMRVETVVNHASAMAVQQLRWSQSKNGGTPHYSLIDAFQRTNLQ